MTAIRAYLGIGGNLVPDGYDTLLSAMQAAIHQTNQIAPVIHRSRWYKTAPVPISDQPDFLNAVLAVETMLSASELLSQLHCIEAGFGRVRSVRNAARVLDIDILFYGDQIINSESLQIPILACTHVPLFCALYVKLPLILSIRFSAQPAPDFTTPFYKPLKGDRPVCL